MSQEPSPATNDEDSAGATARMLPCPSCGETDVDATFAAGVKGGEREERFYNAGCMICGMTGPDSHTPRDAADRWNALPRNASALSEIVAFPEEPTGAMLGLIAGEYDEPVRMNRQQAATVYHAIRALARQSTPSAIRRSAAALKWAVSIFGEGAEDGEERAMRFIEEAVELVNAVGLSAGVVHAIVERIYTRQKGDRGREMGQAMLTLELLAEVYGIDPSQCADVEFARVQAIPKEEWERRHRAKVGAGIAKGDLTVFACKLDKSHCDHDWAHGDGRMDDTCTKCGQLFSTYIHMECP